MKYIKSIKVTNSKFFEDDFEIKFDKKLNCIMGSRGTGKSTLLYFIKSIIDEIGEDDPKVYSILKNNLENGVIELIVEDEDKKEYKIEKSLNDDPQPYDIVTNSHISISKIRNKIKCDIYEALQIEEIGLSSNDRLDLIDKMIIDKEEYYQNIRNAQNELKQTAIDVQSDTKRLNSLKESIINYENCEDDLEAHKKQSPKEITKADSELFKKEEENVKLRRSEMKYIKNIISDIENTETEHDTLFEEFTEKINELNITNEFSNIEILTQINNTSIELYKYLRTNIKNNQGEIKKFLKNIKLKISELEALHEKQQNKYVALKQRFESNKAYFDKYEKLSKRVQEKNDRIKEIQKLEKRLLQVKAQRKKLISKLAKEENHLFEKRYEKVKELNSFLNKEVIITLTRGGITDDYNEKLKIALRGSGMKYSVIGPKIIDNFKPAELAEIINNKDVERLKNISGIDKERSQNLINALYQTDEIYEIESIYCPDLPTFKLRIEEKTDVNQQIYRETENLSTGQRCTAVLPIIFAVSKNPLIIDQPEDNLDNKYITQTIHEIIRKQKEFRQLIFITHNANIPVLSESEQNVFLTYDNNKSSIKEGCSGTVEDVKSNIVKILEGGEKAFKERQRIYGY